MAKDGDSLYHMTTVRPAAFTLVNIFLSVLLIWIFARLEPTINHQYFPNLPEAEVQTYMLGLGIFFLIQILLSPLLTTKILRHIRIASPVVALIASVAVLAGAYLFTQSVLTSAQTRATLGLIHIYQTGNLTPWHFLAGATVSFVVVLLLVQRSDWSIFSNISWHALAILVILWLTLGFNTLNLYDYANYAGPIHDVILGKPLLTSRSNYGFLPILLLGIAFKVVPLTSVTLHLAVAIFNTVGFLLFYFFLGRVLKDPRWAFVATLFTIFGQHLVSNGATYQIPQQTFIRMGMWVFVAIATVLNSSFLPILLVALNVFWTLDFGLYTLVAYALYRLVVDLDININAFIINYIRHMALLPFTLLVLFVIINGVHYSFYGSFPLWSTHYLSALNVLATSSMVRVPPIPAIWMYILVFIATVSYFVYRKTVTKTLSERESAVLFTACVGLVTFNYFLGRSYINSITALSLPFFVCFFYLLKMVLNRCISITKVVSIATILALPGTLLAYQGLQNLQWANPISTIGILQHTNPNALDEEFWVGATVKSIVVNYGDEIKSSTFTLLSEWDTWILVMLHTTNRAGLNCLMCYYPEDDVRFIIKNIEKSPSQYLFVDSYERLKSDRVKRLFSKLQDRYRYVETIGFLEVYQKRK